MSKTINISNYITYIKKKRKLINDEFRPFGKDTVFDEVKFKFLIMKFNCLTRKSSFLLIV